jgi:hypothetical protein
MQHDALAGWALIITATTKQNVKTSKDTKPRVAAWGCGQDLAKL